MLFRSYARIFIDGRWFEAEPYIMKDPEYAYKYARYVIEGRWPEAEPCIMKSADPKNPLSDRVWAKRYAHWYARNFIRVMLGRCANHTS